MILSAVCKTNLVPYRRYYWCFFIRLIVSFYWSDRIDCFQAKSLISVRHLVGFMQSWSMFQAYTLKDPKGAEELLSNTEKRSPAHTQIFNWPVPVIVIWLKLFGVTDLLTGSFKRWESHLLTLKWSLNWIITASWPANHINQHFSIQWISLWDKQACCSK